MEIILLSKIWRKMHLERKDCLFYYNTISHFASTKDGYEATPLNLYLSLIIMKILRFNLDLKQSR